MEGSCRYGGWVDGGGWRHSVCAVLLRAAGGCHVSLCACLCVFKSTTKTKRKDSVCDAATKCVCASCLGRAGRGTCRSGLRRGDWFGGSALML